MMRSIMSYMHNFIDLHKYRNSEFSDHDQHVLSLKTVNSSFSHPRPFSLLDHKTHLLVPKTHLAGGNARGHGRNIRRREFKFYLVWLEIFLMKVARISSFADGKNLFCDSTLEAIDKITIQR